MVRRCTDTKNKAYQNYGGRGIAVCEEWLNFSNFYDWAISNGFSESLTLDRIDNCGNYEPSNCRWVDKETQDSNKRTNVYLTYKGITKTATQWANMLGIPYQSICSRKKSGYSDEDSILGKQKAAKIRNKKKLDTYLQK